MTALKRPRHHMPEFIRKALKSDGLMLRYTLRPEYQRNDYVGWITRAKRPVTQQRRLQQMLDELRAGGIYMKMKWKPRIRR